MNDPISGRRGVEGLPRRAARAAVYRPVEAIWAAGFAVAGRVIGVPREAQRWTTVNKSPTSASDGAGLTDPWRDGARVVIVAPHPDDETIGSGGVAALHTRAGDSVAIVVVTDGGGSRALGLTRNEMVRRRALEVRTAAEILGVAELNCLGLPEWGWTGAQLRRRLAGLLRDATIVYAPSCIDYHPEHMRVARVTADLLRQGQTVRICELGVPLTPLLANRIADIGEVAETKARALAAFETQQASLGPLRRLARYRAALYAADAEVFWELDAAEYKRVVSNGDWCGGTSPYRGIGPRPLLDPLAVLVGLSARRRLRRVAYGTRRGVPSQVLLEPGRLG